MKILFITHYQDLYGANKSLANLLLSLKNRNYDVMVLCPSIGGMSTFLNENNIPHLSGTFYNGWEYKNTKDLIKFPYRFLRTLLTLFVINKSLKKYQPDIIYSNSSVIWIGKAIATFLKKPHVWHVREFGLKDYGLRMVGGKPFTNYLMNRSAAIVSISKAIDAEILTKIRTNIKHQVYDGVVNLSEISTSPKKLKGGAPFNFCMAGLLIASKGYDEAIQAVNILIKQHKNIRLVIAGTGMQGDNYEKFLRRMVEKLELQDVVEFAGFVEDMKGFYKSSDCLLMCSKAEGLGRVTIEAMAQGVPVIGRNSGGTSEIVEDKLNGYLYRDGSYELSKKMIEMINNNDYHTMSKNALETVKEKFSIESFTDRMEKLFQEISK